jgi:hypothetical protein
LILIRNLFTRPNIASQFDVVFHCSDKFYLNEVDAVPSRLLRYPALSDEGIRRNGNLHQEETAQTPTMSDALTTIEAHNLFLTKDAVDTVAQLTPWRKQKETP